MHAQVTTIARIALVGIAALAGCGTSKSPVASNQDDSAGGSTSSLGGSGMGGDSKNQTDSTGGTTLTTTTAGSGPSAGAAGSSAALSGDGSCSAPYLLQGPIVLPSESTVKAPAVVSALSATCLGTETAGPEKIYKIQLPAAGSTKLKVTVVPERKPEADAYDPVLYVTKSCSVHPSCAVARDVRGGGSFETLEYDNQSGAVQEMLIVVDGFEFQPQGGKYKLDVALLKP